MKLKQQIMADSWNYEFPISNIQANHIVDLADEFAIGFAKWIKDDGRTIELLKGSRTPKELLEIYKKYFYL